MEHHAEVLRGSIWHQRVPSWRDLAAILLVLGIVILLGAGAHQMVTPFIIANQPRFRSHRLHYRFMCCARSCACWPPLFFL